MMALSKTKHSCFETENEKETRGKYSTSQVELSLQKPQVKRTEEPDRSGDYNSCRCRGPVLPSHHPRLIVLEAVVNHHPGTKTSDIRKSINTRICELRHQVKQKNKMGD